MITLYADDSQKGQMVFFGGKLIDTLFCQPMEYFKVAKQVEYVTKPITYYLENGLSKHYKSVFNLNMNGYLTGQTMSLLQAGSYSLNAIFLYPAMFDFLNSINGTGPNSDFQNSLGAGAFVGLVQGIINLPLENIKMRQIGNRLLANYPKDFKFAEHPNAFTVSDFTRDEALERRNSLKTNKNTKLSKTEYIAELKKLDKAAANNKETKVLSYIELRKRMITGVRGITPDSNYYNILRACKKSADAMLKNPSNGVFSTIKEMMESGRFDGRNVFFNAWYLVVPISIIETSIFLASLQHLSQCVYEYNSGVEFQDMTYGAQVYTKMKELSFKVPGLAQFAPLFMGVPSAFVTVALTQPFDTLKTMLQSGLFHQFRALADYKVNTIKIHNVIVAFRTYYSSYVDIGKLYHGSLFRFMKLSFIHAGVGFTFSKAIADHVDRYMEKRKLVA